MSWGVRTGRRGWRGGSCRVLVQPPPPTPQPGVSNCPPPHLIWPKDLWECFRQDASQLQVGISDGQVAPLLVAHRTRVGAAGLGTNHKQTVPADRKGRQAEQYSGALSSRGPLKTPKKPKTPDTWVDQHIARHCRYLKPRGAVFTQTKQVSDRAPSLRSDPHL